MNRDSGAPERSSKRDWSGDELDVIIVGAGPVGIACAIELKRVGRSALILEKGAITDAIYRFPVGMTFFTTPELLEIGGHPLICAHGKSTRREALAYYRSVARAEGVRIRTYTEVTGIEGECGSFRVSARDRDGSVELRARRVILATGYFDHPNRLGIPGESLPHVSHYYSEAHPFVGERVLVVGGQNSAAEAALDLHRTGADVTLIHRRETLGESVKYWVRPDLENRIRAGEICAHFSAELVAISPRTVRYRVKEREREEPFFQVFLLTGYHPDAALLRAAGLAPDPDTLAVHVDPETLEARAGLHLAGSCAAGRATGTIFIENGRMDAQRIAAAIAAAEA